MNNLKATLFVSFAFLIQTAICLAQVRTQLELNQTVSYGNNKRLQYLPIRTLLTRPNFERSLLAADKANQWMIQKFGHVLNISGDEGWKGENLRAITESTERGTYLFHFRSSVAVSVNYQTGRVLAVLSGTGRDVTRHRELFPTPLSDSALEAVAQELATLTGVRQEGVEFVARHFPARTSAKAVSLVGCLPGTKLHIGPGVSGNFDETTGLPLHVRFSYDIFPHEPAFMPMMSREEAYALAIPRIQQHVPWPAYRVLVQPPRYANPDYRQRQITRSPRHSALIASGTRCLISTVVVVPVTEDDVITQWVAITFDSQTRELLTVYIQSPGEFGTSAKRVENNLKHNQMIALPNMQLQIPVQPAPGAEKPSEADSLNVLVRQGRITFSAQLDAKNRVLWIEGKPYQSTRAFTRSLQMLFDKTN